MRPVFSQWQLRIRQQIVGSLLSWPMAAFFLDWAAFFWRRLLLGTTFIAVTGSLGKTTTKELLGQILQTKGRTYKTLRNQNGGKLVALNILRVRPWHRYAVIEVGVGRPGQMRRLARLVRPDVAVILGVQRTHTTAFVDLDQHAREKSILLRHLRPGGVAVLNGEDARVKRLSSSGQDFFFGMSNDFDFWATDVTSSWPNGLSFAFHSGEAVQRVQTQLVGEHWVVAVTAALSVGLLLGVGGREAAGAIQSVSPFPGRLSRNVLPSGAIFLRDDYNASIEALEAAFKVLKSIPNSRRFLVITDFSDFGKNRRQRLKFLVEQAAGIVEQLVLIGERADYGCRRAQEVGFPSCRVEGFSTVEHAAHFLRGELRSGDVVLLKGRTTDHAGRIFLAQLGAIHCWKEYCPKRLLCDFCWELRAEKGPLHASDRGLR